MATAAQKEQAVKMAAEIAKTYAATGESRPAVAAVLRDVYKALVKIFDDIHNGPA